MCQLAGAVSWERCSHGRVVSLGSCSLVTLSCARPSNTPENVTFYTWLFHNISQCPFKLVWSLYSDMSHQEAISTGKIDAHWMLFYCLFVCFLDCSVLTPEIVLHENFWNLQTSSSGTEKNHTMVKVTEVRFLSPILRPDVNMNWSFWPSSACPHALPLHWLLRKLHEWPGVPKRVDSVCINSMLCPAIAE